MVDEKLARLRTHRGNIQRYRQLLETSLTDLEREIHRQAPCGGAVGCRNALCDDATTPTRWPARSLNRKL